MDWSHMAQIWTYLSVATSVLCFVVMVVITFQAWRSQRRVIKANLEYQLALERAVAHLKANPSAWLEAMHMMDDKRRQH